MIEFFQDIGSLIMDPLYFVTSFILTTFHELFSGWFGGSDAGQGWAWALSIVCLTIVIRILLIPLFVKQIKSSRNMQLLQPKVKELQKKYGHDRERLSRETMALYKETGTNPFASCLPLILQMPIFLALFRLISRAATEGFEWRALHDGRRTGSRCRPRRSSARGSPTSSGVRPTSTPRFWLRCWCW